MTTASPIDPNRLLLTGENPYIRLSETDDGPVTSDASFWRILFSPGGPGHVLFLQSELTDHEPLIYTDNIQMTRWLQGEIQGRINATFGNLEIPATEASFRSSGDLRSFWTEWVTAHDEDITLTWYDLGEPFMSHSFPGGNPERPHGVSTVLIPGQRGENHLERTAGVGAAFPAAAGRSGSQHLCSGVLGVVDAALRVDAGIFTPTLTLPPRGGGDFSRKLKAPVSPASLRERFSYISSTMASRP